AEVLRATLLPDDAALVGVPRLPHGDLQHLPCLPGRLARRRHRVGRGGTILLEPDAMAGELEGALHPLGGLRARAGELVLTLAGGLVEAGLFLAAHRVEQARVALVAAVPRIQGAARTQATGAVSGAACIGGAALAVVHVHTRAVGVDAVIGAGVEV